MWHVDRAWRNAAKQYISSKENRLLVYHYLQVLQTENEETKFRLLLQFLSFLNNNETVFYAYFTTKYCNRLQQWASCYRTGTAVNTNMFVESFYRLLKIVYLHSKQNRRIDYLLNTLLNIA